MSFGSLVFIIYFDGLFIMKKRDSYVQVYTGNGKGKTTAALGLAIRALGAGKKVAFIQFMKAVGYSEHKTMRQFAPNLVHVTVGKPFFILNSAGLTDEEIEGIKSQLSMECVVFPPGQPPAEYVELVREGLAQTEAITRGGEYDLVVLDELNCALFFDLVSWETVEAIIDGRHDRTELVLTGRGAPQALMDKADLVTEMREIKHYFNQGVMARRGIES